MIEIDFGAAAGGMRSFQNTDELKEFLSEQEKRWREIPVFKEHLKQRHNAASDQITRLPEKWREAQLVLQPPSSPPVSIEQAAKRLQNHLRKSTITSADSEDGQAIIAIAKEQGLEVAAGAIVFQLSSLNDTPFQNLTKIQTIGAFAFRDKLAGLTPEKMSAARNSIAQLKGDLGRDVASHREELEQFSGMHREGLENLKRQIAEERAEFQEFRTSAASKVETQRQEWSNKWDELFELYTERLRLEASVDLWRKRGEKHEGNGIKLRKIVTWIGIIGFFLAALLGIILLIITKKILSEAGLKEPEYPIVLSASATLLYLTMYFWTMRISVRMYMTEHHLGIDARSRESMAHTYLALTKEEAATDADRAIVLASLFRPVVDGIVKDDGLPAITPAAILAGIAGGRSTE